MSASPANGPSGPNSVTPNTGGPQPPIPRKKAPPSIFAAKKKPAKPLPLSKGKTPAGKASNATNGNVKPNAQQSNGAEPTPQEQDYQDFPIYISRRPEDREARYHTLKIQSRLEGSKYVVINPFDESQFTRPVHLFRRNANETIEMADTSEAAAGIDDKEREMMSARRAERQAEREANQAQIAPSGGSQNKPGGNRGKKPKKKVEERFDKPSTLARQQLSREEARPWHLEDFDGKNKWVASYEAPMSKSHAMFALTSDGFRMIPLEKWYTLRPVSKLDKIVDAEQIEKQMAMRAQPSRWWKGTQTETLESRRRAAEAQREERKKKPRDSDDEQKFKRDEYQADVDEIDFEYGDEFQDDDEGFIFGDPQDEETKEIESRLREEMRSANIGGSGLRDENFDYDEAERKEKEAARQERKKQKRLRRQLQNKERRHEYESDESEADSLLVSEDESEDSEEERERLEKESKEEEARKAALANGDKSGASTKGTNTPSGRVEKKPQFSLKREADGSDLSGNESSRKRAKIKGGGSSEMSNGARSLSPDAAKRMPSGYGSGSDTDASRPGRSKKLKLRNSPPGSPTSGSRSGTPMASRAQSPTRPTSTGPASSGIASPPAQPFPTPEEIKAAIPESGIDLKALVEIFKRRVGPKSKEFIALVRQNARLDATTKLLVPSKSTSNAATPAKQG